MPCIAALVRYACVDAFVGNVDKISGHMHKITLFSPMAKSTHTFKQKQALQRSSRVRFLSLNFRIARRLRDVRGGTKTVPSDSPSH